MRRAASSWGAGTRWVRLAGFSLLVCFLGPSPAWAATAPAQTSQAQRNTTQERPRPAVKRRDPFRSLLIREEDAAVGRRLPPGKRGLVVAQLSINGIVFTPARKIAVVTMRGRNRAYFLREGDELFNGRVQRITEDGVVFKEKAIDAFGNQYEREVVKQLSGSGGEK